jgi:hypothetical protein
LETSIPFTSEINQSGSSALLQTSDPGIIALKIVPPLPSNQDGKFLCPLSNCPESNKQFARKRLREHFTKSHEDAYPVSCPVLGSSCTEEFSSYLHLNTHMKEVHLKHGLSLLMAAQSWECRDESCVLSFHKSGKKRYLKHLVKVHMYPEEVNLTEGEGGEGGHPCLVEGCDHEELFIGTNNYTAHLGEVHGLYGVEEERRIYMKGAHNTRVKGCTSIELQLSLTLLLSASLLLCILASLCILAFLCIMCSSSS